MEGLTPLFRRVLATLPAWYSAEDETKLDAEAAAESHVRVRSHTLDELHKEMVVNPHAQLKHEDSTPEDQKTRPMAPAEVARLLEHLVHKGWAAIQQVAVAAEGETVQTVDHWKMTQEGFEELHRPEAAPENVVPGPVKIEVDQAIVDTNTSAGVQTNA